MQDRTRSIRLWACMLVAALQVACGGGSDDAQTTTQTPTPVAPQPATPTTPSPTTPTSITVPLATCGQDDKPETGLQGQVPMSERAAGFQGYSCNLKKASSVPAADLGYRQFVTVRDRSGHFCGYAGGVTSLGSANTMVVDMTDPDNLVKTTELSTAAMMSPGEGLRTHTARGLLLAAHYNAVLDTSSQAHGLDVYDVGTDCRFPQLLTSTTLNFSTAGIPPYPGAGAWPAEDAAYGHEGALSPDGLTYFIGDYPHGVYHAVDITDPTHPVLLSTFLPPGATGLKDFLTGQGVVHGLSVSNDGNRAYFTTGAIAFRTDAMVPQTGEWRNGFLVVDTSQVQARVPNARMRLISEENYHDNEAEQMTIPFMVKGHRYLLSTGESGTGGIGPTGKKQACGANLTPFGIARIYDLQDEAAPTLVKKIVLEVNDPKNCSLIQGEIDSIRGLIYDSHMCSVDNRDEATTLVCSHFQSGIRVFDIRDPANIKEIAYYNPPSAAGPGKPLPWCGALSTLDAATGRLYSACGGAGVLSLKFVNSVWPFAGSTTPNDKQQ